LAKSVLAAYLPRFIHSHPRSRPRVPSPMEQALTVAGLFHEHSMKNTKIDMIYGSVQLHDKVIISICSKEDCSYLYMASASSMASSVVLWVSIMSSNMVIYAVIFVVIVRVREYFFSEQAPVIQKCISTILSRIKLKFVSTLSCFHQLYNKMFKDKYTLHIAFYKEKLCKV
jgi:hypothetical protein